VSGLISIDEARRRVLGAVRRLPAEEVPLAKALGRVLAEDVESGIDVPPFDSSAMDGYAVIAGPAAELELIGEARAGHPAAEPVRPGTAIRISTGAAIPPGATAVVPLERSEVLGGGAAAGTADERGTAEAGAAAAGAAEPGAAAEPAAAGRVRVQASSPGDNVRRAGEDVPAGRRVLGAGVVLGPAELGVAASVGRAALLCSRRPRVAVLVTGDELTEPGEPLEPGGIYGSNGFVLAAQTERAGARLAVRETVRDDPDQTREALARALDSAEVVIVSGGVSVGPHDHVKSALESLGVEQRFYGVRLRPGKPTWFGTRDDRLAFGLPGNPVSATVAFQLFVRPALAALQGADPDARRTPATLAEPLPRHPIREQAVRVRLAATDDGWRATSTGAQGSHMLTSMLGADALALIPPGEGELASGARVEVELL
jgi:molybdopterin molybdotransferase